MPPPFSLYYSNLKKYLFFLFTAFFHLLLFFFFLGQLLPWVLFLFKLFPCSQCFNPLKLFLFLKKKNLYFNWISSPSCDFRWVLESLSLLSPLSFFFTFFLESFPSSVQILVAEAGKIALVETGNYRSIYWQLEVCNYGTGVVLFVLSVTPYIFWSVYGNHYISLASFFIFLDSRFTSGS